MDPDTEQMKVFEGATDLFELVAREAGTSWSQYTQGSEEARDDILLRYPDFPRHMICMALGRGLGRVEGEERQRDRDRRAKLSPLRTSSRGAWNIRLERIWIGRTGQIIAAATFVVLITWCAFWGGERYGALQELGFNIGDRAYQACLVEALTAAQLSGAANEIEEPCRRQQEKAQARVVSMFRGIVWQEALDNFLMGPLIWFSLCGIAAGIRFLVREAQILFS